MLMDLFFKTVCVERKQRVHFNKFMRTVHDSESPTVSGLLVWPLLLLSCVVLASCTRSGSPVVMVTLVCRDPSFQEQCAIQ